MVFESKDEEVASFKVFYKRIAITCLVAILIAGLALIIGTLGFRYYEETSWLESYVNAAMILSDVGPTTPLLRPGGKLFASFYALFSGPIFITIVGVVFSPIAHRFMHKFYRGRVKKNV